ncbi:DUF58 domain-containing protein [Lichenicola sp.]|uniref:DUF58 domain-containing protein n=1 Tax=Lichenicola sp. TaxID=2804529 RepID=UPI003AFFADBA
MRLPSPISGLARRLGFNPAAEVAGRTTSASTGRGARVVGPERMRLDAEALAARLPALLAESDRVASTVAQGVHGRRRAGSGDSFWQYRQLMPGESITRMDWRQSARSSRAYVRETEWEAAQTVCLWVDRSASMDWRSDDRLTRKGERAELLALALAILLLRGGEHVRLIDEAGGARFSGRQAAERLARHLLHPRRGDADGGPAGGWPTGAELPRHARLVLIGDFLAPLPEIEVALARFAAVPVAVQLVQLLDPAELALPYAGRVRFEGTEGEAPHLVPRVQDIAAAYADVLEQHQAGLAALCSGVGFGRLLTTTDQPPASALLALHEALGRPHRTAPGLAAPPGLPAADPAPGLGGVPR